MIFKKVLQPNRWIPALPKMIKRMKSDIRNSKIMQKATASKIMGRYLTDTAFRGSINIYQGMTVNFFYVVFRVIAGIRYASVWFISMAVYYLVLGILRLYLIYSYRHRSPELESRCYRRTAWMLFLLNILYDGNICSEPCEIP